LLGKIFGQLLLDQGLLTVTLGAHLEPFVLVQLQNGIIDEGVQKLVSSDIVFEAHTGYSSGSVEPRQLGSNGCKGSNVFLELLQIGSTGRCNRVFQFMDAGNILPFF
jgi:hypothetical protein